MSLLLLRYLHSKQNDHETHNTQITRLSLFESVPFGLFRSSIVKNASPKSRFAPLKFEYGSSIPRYEIGYDHPSCLLVTFLFFILSCNMHVADGAKEMFELFRKNSHYDNSFSKLYFNI